jgi:Ca2+-binding RTX toxin-like protein
MIQMTINYTSASGTNNAFQYGDKAMNAADNNRPSMNSTRGFGTQQQTQNSALQSLFDLDSLLMQLRKYTESLETGGQSSMGSACADKITGGSGNDTIKGRGGNDDINGGAGDDLLKGGRGDDVVQGGDGNDTIRGGKGDDQLKGGSGDDVLTGGKGNDTFQFNPANANEGADTIKDFEVGKDTIELALKDIVASTPDGGDGFQVSDLDAPGSGWSLSATDNGDVQVNHPGGTIALEGVKLDAVLEMGITSFEGLVEAGVVKAV